MSSRTPLFLFLAGWTALIGSLGYIQITREYQFDRGRAVAAIDTFVEEQNHVHLWVARHGGVYVPATTDTPPNPYLQDLVDEQELTTPSGRHLTLLDPSSVTRQLLGSFHATAGPVGRLVSTTPLNPDNRAIGWEVRALEQLQSAGRQKFIEEVEMGGERQLRFMAPFFVTTTCLECHTRQGYQAGELRGGLAVVMPLGPFLAHRNEQIGRFAATHGLIWLLGLGGILGAFRVLHRQSNQLPVGEERLRKANRDLRRHLDTVDLALMLKKWLPPEHRHAVEESAAPAAEEPAPPPSPPPPPPAEDDPAALDGAVLDRLRSLQRPGQPSVVERMAELFLAECPRLLERITRGCEARDTEEIRRVAHSLKSSAASLGAQRLSAVARDMEQAARDGRDPTPLRAALLEAFEATRPLLVALQQESQRPEQ